MKTQLTRWGAALAGLVCAIFLGPLVFADEVPTPVLKLESLGTNQFSISITNGVTNVNYEVHWTPALNDVPWQMIGSGAQGVTNWTVDMTGWSAGYFKVSVGNDWDADTVPNWMDASPNNASIGALTVVIDSPLHGSTIQ